MRRAAFFIPLLLALPAAAQDRSGDDLGRAHFESGSAYYDQGRYDDAAREFMEAYRLSGRAALLENTARAQERGLHYDEAIATLELLLSEHPDYATAPVIRERIRSYEALRDRLAAQQGGETETETETDTETEEPESGTATEGEPIPAAHGGGSSGARSEGGGGGVSVPGIIVLASGGALGLASIITGAVSQGIYDGLQTDCMMSACPADRQGDVDTGEALALTSTILMFPSIIAIGVGIVLLIVDSGGGGDEAQAVQLVPGPGDAGLALRGRL